MRNQHNDRSPRYWPSGPLARLGRLAAMVVLVGVAGLLTGCMEALQSSSGAELPPPAALPSPTALATSEVPAGAAERPAFPGSYAPDPATAAPTLTPTVAPPTSTPASTPTVAPTQVIFPTLALPTHEPLTPEDRWRAQQRDRRPFEAPRPYYTTGSELWWYDPVNQQSVILGRITGEFLGQAEFVLHGQGVPALEVPYQINISYGLTALSPVLVERIMAAGYTEWIETYVFLTPDVTPR